MRRWAVAVSMTAVAAATSLTLAGSAGAHERPDPRVASGGMAGVVHARGASAGHGKPGSSPNLLFHGGAIMTSTSVRAIFWGSKWGQAGFTGDKRSGLDAFYGGIGGTQYLNTNREYTGTNGQVGTGVTNGAQVVDTSTAPSRAPSTSAVLAEVAKVITAPVANGYYPVYVDTPRGSTGYCAWHSYGTINGVPVTFGFFFNLDGDPGCDPGDASGTKSQGLEALANVSGHEISETLTDPRNGGWWDSKGAENADKCAWTFHGTSNFGGEQWLIQGNWSNAAYTSRSGYDSLKGCIV